MIEWKTSSNLVPLKYAIRTMEQRVLDIRNNRQKELIWLLEHPHVYSGGTSVKDEHILAKSEIPVELTRRGGSYTYHGPGQRVIYIMLDLKKQGKDIRKFVWSIEQWIIDSLRDLGVVGERRSNRIGIWVCPTAIKQNDIYPSNELKIASVGLRVKNWISYFGASINVHPELNYFDGIVACGNEGYGVTSLKQQGLDRSLTRVDRALQHNFKVNFKHIGSKDENTVCDDHDS
ncbi:MAG: lipoyl(octanoyl) transferase LipB [Paracoccaceae bacterium]|nr:lipoyl(octanoyl) transferase LipB [Paracoccaceae bacterium]